MDNYEIKKKIDEIIKLTFNYFVMNSADPNAMINYQTVLYIRKKLQDLSDSL